MKFNIAYTVTVASYMLPYIKHTTDFIINLILLAGDKPLKMERVKKDTNYGFIVSYQYMVREFVFGTKYLWHIYPP